MNLFELGKETKHQNTVRVLVLPNVTYAKDIEADSFVQCLKKQITLLNEIRNDLWFYLILPVPVPSLQYANSTQWYIPLPTFPQTMRHQMDVPKIQKLLSRNFDFDLIMSHLPDHTVGYKSICYNVTHHTPPIFGYAHWWDFKSQSGDNFLPQIIGALQYDRCYINTQAQKNLVLNQARETFNVNTISKLDDILTVQHLGVDAKDIIDNINETPEKIIVFNHRPDTYKHFKQFMAVCDKLWEMRQDFKVWIPLLDKPNRDYVVTTKFNKKGYYKELQNCYMGFAPKQTYGGWSVAATDGMMNGCPFVFYDDTYYHELMQTADFFKDDHEALMLMNTYLDDPQFRNEQAERALDWMREKLIYKDKMIEMSEYMDKLLDKAHKISYNSEKLQEILQWIKNSGSVSKLELIDKLGWGRGIKWTPYRRALMNHPNIYDVKGSNPTYCWKD